MGRRGQYVLLLVLTGMRAGEARKAKVSGIVTVGGRRYVKTESKEGDERLIPIRGRLLALVDSLTQGRSPDDFLIHDGRGGQVKRSRLTSAVTVVGEVTKINGLHPHRLRHGFADWLRRKGVDMRTIQAILGHRSLETTMGYFKVTHADLDAVGDRMERE